VLVEHDLTLVAQARARQLLGGSIWRHFGHWLDELRTLRHEIAAVESADVVLTMSDDDRRTLARFVDPANVVVVPNGVSCADFPFRAEEAEPATILFVGFFRHEPNVEAVRWFASEVLPRVRARVPQAIFRVVGAYPPPALEELAQGEPAIEVTGMVPETASHYRRATVFVAPVLRGSGTRLKILEAFASGCPVVATTIGAEGLAAGSDVIRIADDPDALARAIVELIEDPGASRAMAERARAFAEERFDWSAIGRRQLEAWGIEPAREVEAAA
jgi:glycosyltransferase involved in cell wall biosynthesis